jgi:hypothetical protein
LIAIAAVASAVLAVSNAEFVFADTELINVEFVFARLYAPLA